MLCDTHIQPGEFGKGTVGLGRTGVDTERLYSSYQDCAVRRWLKQKMLDQAPAVGGDGRREPAGLHKEDREKLRLEREELRERLLLANEKKRKSAQDELRRMKEAFAESETERIDGIRQAAAFRKQRSLVTKVARHRAHARDLKVSRDLRQQRKEHVGLLRTVEEEGRRVGLACIRNQLGGVNTRAATSVSGLLAQRREVVSVEREARQRKESEVRRWRVELRRERTDDVRTLSTQRRELAARMRESEAERLAERNRSDRAAFMSSAKQILEDRFRREEATRESVTAARSEREKARQHVTSPMHRWLAVCNKQRLPTTPPWPHVFASRSIASSFASSPANSPRNSARGSHQQVGVAVPDSPSSLKSKSPRNLDPSGEGPGEKRKRSRLNVSE